MRSQKELDDIYLQFACGSLNIDMVKRRIRAGADVNCMSSIVNRTPLQITINSNFSEEVNDKIDMIELLMENGVEIPDDILLSVNFTWHPRLVSFLLEKGADPLVTFKEQLPSQRLEEQSKDIRRDNWYVKNMEESIEILKAAETKAFLQKSIMYNNQKQTKHRRSL